MLPVSYLAALPNKSAYNASYGERVERERRESLDAGASGLHGACERRVVCSAG